MGQPGDTSGGRRALLLLLGAVFTAAAITAFWAGAAGWGWASTVAAATLSLSWAASRAAAPTEPDSAAIRLFGKGWSRGLWSRAEWERYHSCRFEYQGGVDGMPPRQIRIRRNQHGGIVVTTPPNGVEFTSSD